MTEEAEVWTADAVYSIVMFRVSSTDEEWEQDQEIDPTWPDLTRAEAARRLARQDYSPPT